MGLLGDFLEALVGPEPRFRTVRATIRCRTDEAAKLEAARSANEPVGRARQAPSPKASAQTEEQASVWLALPDCVRVERHGAGWWTRQHALEIVNGDQEWTRNDQGHVAVGSSTGQTDIPTDVARHFQSKQIREIVNVLTLEATGTSQIAGRACVQMRAFPGKGLWPHWLPTEADEYELHADPERATVLKIVARHGGVEFEWFEVTELAFDESLDAALFIYEPAAGEQVAAAAPVAEMLTLEAAAARVRFTILVPTLVPDAAHSQMHVHYNAPRGPGGAGRQSITVGYYNFTSDFSLWLEESDAPDPADKDYEWEDFEASDRRFRVSDPGAGGLRLLAFELAGTYLCIRSNLERAKLVEVALSLSPVAKPPMG